MAYRNTYCKIDLDSFIHNYQLIKNDSQKEVFAVIKANAYGHGDLQIAKTADQLGCAYLCVSSLDEALHLRKHGISGGILVLGYVNPEYAMIAASNQITLTACSDEFVQALKPIAGLKVHIKIDTGMNRIGFKRLDDVKKALQDLDALGIEVEGIFTHLHSADTNEASSKQQLTYFYAVIDNLNRKFKWIHSGNSDTTILKLDQRSNACRLGLALYGIKDIKSDLALKPVLSLYSEIVHVKTIQANESVGYGATYQALHEEKIATVCLGYADGFIRKNQGRYVAVNGYPYEIVGRICMDQFMIRVDKDYPLGTPVEVIGENTSLAKMSNELDMIPYEVLTLLSDRIERKFYRDGKLVEVYDART